MWWDRGYDTRGANLTCRRCGAVINRNPGYTGDEYWMAHDDFHQEIDEALLRER